MSFADREKSRGKKSVIASMISDEVQEQKVSGRGRPKAERETKQRISLAVLPSLYEDIKKIAFVERKSISEIISDCLEIYVNSNNDKLNEYDNIKK